MPQQYSLKWNNHQPNFISMFTTFLNTQSMVDVTLATDGQQLSAHKVVLAACSTYFQSLFVDNPAQHPIVILKDVTFADLRIIVDFMYCGEVNVTEEQLPKVLDTAKHLKIKGLTEMPDSTSLTRSSANNAEFQNQGDSLDSHRQSPAVSPSTKRKRQSSSGSASMSMLEDVRADVGAQAGAGGDTVTLSSVPQHRRREYHEIRTIDNAQQTTENTENAPVNQSALMENAQAVMPQGGQWPMMEHPYPRYSNACLSTMQEEPIYMNNVMNQHMQEINFGQGLEVAGPSPGPSCAEVHAPPDAPLPTQKRRRTIKPQSEENFQRALEAVRYGNIGFCKAARLFGVNNRTLWLEYKKRGYPNHRPSIRNRIKRECTTPPPERKEPAPAAQQMALLCAPPQGFIEQPQAFPMQGVPQNSPINILGVNFNALQ
ncbi:longitudinals lacking protein, isoforms H/M/V-like isoform X2 [Helicoverpa zea]|uniref:longitudinals lacking protein, isoforms H/M/V-like isoform X2 n=1 Tax=Helicoverpa zea TaxID=7113 RepID=UPI000B3685B8|nr:longitudinals lacking protein, isoforms H/M/V-like isoform X2 [Helicoverpa zea]